ncbi:hypothetical protein K490DRAFT_65337 [Saccharata proteae CBS 121410]|uniref:Lytic polysaccharide monooxygenase n=1 Tax=Saccharata proteae CBS 121410 TaxID=1314787 RepID=A0A9P4HYT2_9PEZI|nr:hypothetical protein K490DRAFT_65337 [Saccharata proteae CBS 121410]
MAPTTKTALSAILFTTLSSMIAPSVAAPAHANNTLTAPYSLSAYAPGNAHYNGGKMQGAGGLFLSHPSQYCPTNVAPNCPNGTDSSWAASLYPITEVPGGQDLYVNKDGSIGITVQHSHTIPQGAYWEYQGWSWTALPVTHQKKMHGCPAANNTYNCAPPTGYFTFHAPDAKPGVGGVMACPSLYNAGATAVYAVTPEFNRTDCVELMGLGTHKYTGQNPPVWAY